MPKQYRMTWEPGKTRWRKMHKGTLHIVSCAELNAPIYTKEASYKLANAWWERKLAELNQPDPAQELLDRYEVMDLRETINRAKRELHAAQEALRLKGYTPQEDDDNDLWEHARRLANKPDGTLDHRIVAGIVGHLEDEPVQTDRTIGHQAERFLELEKARGMKPRTHQDLSAFIHKAIRCPHLSEKMDVGKIKEQTLTNLYAWLRDDSGMVRFSQLKCFSFFKRFVQWLYGERLIDRPRNLDQRTFTFGNGAKAVKTYSISQVTEMLAKLPERLRLYACLALNCAMLGIDMATLNHDELQGDRIVRKRTKTGERFESVPTVSYPLWPETVTLLNKYPRTHPEYVLTSKTGTKLVRDGKKGRTDLVGQQWKRRKLPIPLKALRSHAADLLGEGGYPLQIQQVFLCHAPGTVAERHYVNYPQQKLDEAVMWLRGRYFEV